MAVADGTICTREGEFVQFSALSQAARHVKVQEQIEYYIII